MLLLAKFQAGYLLLTLLVSAWQKRPIFQSVQCTCYKLYKQQLLVRELMANYFALLLTTLLRWWSILRTENFPLFALVTFFVEFQSIVLCLLSMPNIWNSLIAWEQRLELFHHKSLLYLILSCGFSLNVFVCRRGPPKNTCLIEFHFILYLSKKTLRCSTQLYSSA